MNRGEAFWWGVFGFVVAMGALATMLTIAYGVRQNGYDDGFKCGRYDVLYSERQAGC